MAKPVTLSSAKMLIQLGDGGSPEVFAAPCGLTTKGLTFTKTTNDTTVPDCDDPDLVSWTERGVVSMSGTITGSGVLAMEALETWRAAAFLTISRNARLLLDHIDGGYFQGLFHLTTFTLGGELGNKVSVTVELQNDGEIVWVPTP